MAMILKKMLGNMSRVEFRRKQRFSKAKSHSSFLRQRFGFKRKRKIRFKTRVVGPS
jgi:hypothetical protein